MIAAGVDGYQARKERGLCVRCGSDAAEDSLYCAPHREDARARAKRSIAKRRALLEKQKRCRWCSQPSTLAVCRECRPSRSGVVNNVVDIHHLPPTLIGGIARPKPQGVWTVDTATEADGRTRSRNRYRGKGRRGGPGIVESYEFDLRAVESEVSRIRADLQLYASEENQQLPRIQKLAPRQSALGHVRLIMAIAEEIEERLGKGLK